MFTTNTQAVFTNNQAQPDIQPFDTTFKPDVFDFVILQGILNRQTFSRMAVICMTADKQKKKRGTSFIQFRVRRLIDAGFVYQSPEAKGTTGSYSLTEEAMTLMNHYKVNNTPHIPIVQRVE